MLREDDTNSNGDIGVLHYRKSFRYSKRETMDRKEYHHREFEESYPCALLHITSYGERKRK
jgi:hypothetical protein